MSFLWFIWLADFFTGGAVVYFCCVLFCKRILADQSDMVEQSEIARYLIDHYARATGGKS